MEFKKVKRKNLMCDGCSESNSRHKLDFSPDMDSVYMCDRCFENMEKALEKYKAGLGKE